jgi:pimeloyl-ACP methyl ester carboxylesterase
MALRHPGRVRAVIVFNNPCTGRSRRRPSAGFAAIARDHFLHLHYFQQPVRLLLQRLLALLGRPRLCRRPAASPPLPWSWLTGPELDYFAAEFGRTGFTGGLNWYRSMDLRWEQPAGLDPVIRGVPAFFLAGERDVDLAGFSGRDPVERMRGLVPGLREVVRIPQAGHLVQLEQPAALNSQLLRFLVARLHQAPALATSSGRAPRSYTCHRPHPGTRSLRLAAGTAEPSGRRSARPRRPS